MVVARTFGLLSAILRIGAIVAVVFVVAGLVGFLTDEVRDTSDVQQTRIVDPGQATTRVVVVDITQPDPPASIERVREAEHTGAREVIDDVGDVLMGPFSWIIQDSEPWVRRLLYSALALVFYGFLLLVFADFVRRKGDEARRLQISARAEAAAAERKRTGTYVSPA